MNMKQTLLYFVSVSVSYKTYLKAYLKLCLFKHFNLQKGNLFSHRLTCRSQSLICSIPSYFVFSVLTLTTWNPPKNYFTQGISVRNLHCICIHQHNNKKSARITFKNVPFYLFIYIIRRKARLFPTVPYTLNYGSSTGLNLTENGKRIPF